ncbi:hypothetical protein [Streptomyces sediminimaris]|uniref:hypothetical protein n=1 Tax=Streptomyces sediminimaris TaxID=3383721 RepID=UPI00399A48D2
MRRRSDADGALDGDAAPLVNTPGVHHPAVTRSVAAEHTPVRGATGYEGLVRDALVAQHLVSKGLVRVG